MAKNDNLTDFLTDVADAIREKKGTTEKINPQEFSNEIASIKTSSSIWTGHVDVEGLKAIGWDDEDIAYYQEHGVNWMEEEDEYHKVSDDNKALYGVLTIHNIPTYKDRIVWLPKIDTSKLTKMNNNFDGCKNMVGMPMIDTSNATEFTLTFSNCNKLSTIPPLNYLKTTTLHHAFKFCYNLQYIPPIIAPNLSSINYIFYRCVKLSEVSITSDNSMTGNLSNADCASLKMIKFSQSAYLANNYFYRCMSLSHIYGVSGETKFNSIAFMDCYALTTLHLIDLKYNLVLSESFLLTKDSILYILNHEAATEAITITLHKDAYARLATDPDIVAALAEHPLVSLASA